jgi:hypothetical protein
MIDEERRKILNFLGFKKSRELSQTWHKEIWSDDKDNNLDLAYPILDLQFLVAMQLGH